MGRAYGKVILLGEHAVVYGVPAIAAGLDRGAHARATLDEAPSLVIAGAPVTPSDGSELGRAFGAILESLEAPALRVELDLELPAGCGLGASAAMGAATARAVLEALGRDATPRAVLTATEAWERVFHGNPSGIDAAAATLGGCLVFSRADGPRALAVARPLNLAIGLAGPPAPTRAMVESVARLSERRPALVEKSLEGIRSLVTGACLAIAAGDAASLGKLLDLNQMLLAGLLVSTEELELACRIAREAGALGAKLTGAGGGGAVVALTGASPEPVLEAWRRRGIEGFSARVDASGAP
ncbi:MAG: mevalonate kinase [Sorangiineae bacterium]|nr:mevalonate kinase [Polyangiaceae bacterium]MEB2323137.1 mevalonate kinase [Sorangiineae bacterium]